jgi:hypothetical protein
VVQLPAPAEVKSFEKGVIGWFKIMRSIT